MRNRFSIALVLASLAASPLIHYHLAMALNQKGDVDDTSIRLLLEKTGQ